MEVDLAGRAGRGDAPQFDALRDRRWSSNDVADARRNCSTTTRALSATGLRNLYGHEEVARISCRTLADQSCAHALAHRHHHLRPRLRRCLDPVPPRQHAGQGRPADADLGTLPRGLARRGGASEPHRRSCEGSPDERTAALCPGWTPAQRGARGLPCRFRNLAPRRGPAPATLRRHRARRTHAGCNT